MLSDSRVSWKGSLEPNIRNKYDNTQKIFYLKNSIDVFGYCGDIQFGFSIISQIISYLDISVDFTSSNDIVAKKQIIENLLVEKSNNYPALELSGGFKIFWNSLTNNQLFSFAFGLSKNGEIIEPEIFTFPIVTGLVFYDGSGGKYYESALRNLGTVTNEKETLNNYSRNYFKALADVIESSIDPKTGGSPQMISIRLHEKDIKPVGFMFNSSYYIFGIEDKHNVDLSKTEFRDLNYNFLKPDGTTNNNYRDSYTRKLNLVEWKETVINL